MSNKHFIGKRLFSFSDNGLRDPVSRITLMVDDNKAVTAGDDTGLELLANCPYADDTLAQALLNQVKGYQYRAFNAQSADLDPAAELGDGVTADGVYSILASLTDNGDGYPDLAAPGDREEKDEYPEGGPMTRLFNRQLATTRSLIAKNSEAIELKISSAKAESLIKQTLNDITLSVSSTKGVTSISLTGDGVSVKAENLNLSVKAANIEGTLTADKIDATNLHVNAANIDGTLTIGKLPSNVATTGDIPTKVSELTNDKKYQTETGVTNIVEGVVTTDYLYALGVSATYLRGETVVLADEDDDEVGGIDLYFYDRKQTVDIYSKKVLWLTGGSEAVLMYGNFETWLSVSEDGTVVSDDFVSQNAGLLGLSTSPWDTLFADSCSCCTSDENKKNSIEELPEKYLTMFDNLHPKRFKMNNGKSGRYHPGYTAQDVKAAMDIAEIDSTEFGGWIEDTDKDGNKIYMLRYEEFGAIYAAKIKQLEARVAELEVKA